MPLRLVDGSMQTLSSAETNTQRVFFIFALKRRILRRSNFGLTKFVKFLDNLPIINDGVSISSNHKSWWWSAYKTRSTLFRGQKEVIPFR